MIDRSKIVEKMENWENERLLKMYRELKDIEREKRRW